jgi:hypothetical protein
MKKVMLLAVVVSMALGMSSVSRAADDAAPKKDKAARHAELLKKYDKNGDGKLDDAEKAAMKEDLKKHKKGDKKEDSK